MSGVIVVGAGFAGLAAARRLRQAGVSPVVVLEASSAVGGRARTLRLSPELGLEMGATWIHGIRGTQGDPNPILELAQELDLLGPDPPEYAWPDAHFLQPGRTALLEADEVRCITACSEAFELGVESHPPPGQGVSMGDAATLAWTQFLAQHKVEGGGLNASWQALAPAVWQWHARLQCVVDGADTLDDMPCHVEASYRAEVPDRHAVIPAGYQAVATGLAQGLDIRLGTRVTNIRWANEKPGVLVTCADGTQLAAAAAIVTVSLGVLKEHHAELFTPNLPVTHRRAMDRMRMGTVDKLFVEFVVPGASGTAGDTTAGDAQEPEEDEDSYALLWEPEGQENQEHVHAQLPGWARHVFAISFGGAPVKRWSGDAPENTKTPRSTVAVAWIGGEAARETAQASDAHVLDGLRGIWQAFPGLPLLPGASWDDVRLHRSRWVAEREFCGSYSFPLDLEAPQALAQPICSPGAPPEAGPVVLIAGEACAKAFGTAHGALLSGQAAADHVLTSQRAP